MQFNQKYRFREQFEEILLNFKLARTDYKPYKNSIVVTMVDSEYQTIASTNHQVHQGYLQCCETRDTAKCTANKNATIEKGYYKVQKTPLHDPALNYVKYILRKSELQKNLQNA